MKRISISVLDGLTREPIEATLIDSISDAELRETEHLWKPYLQWLRRATHVFPEHKHWNWQHKIAEMTHDDRIYGIHLETRIQGLIIVKDGRTSRVSRQETLPLIYVDFLQVAPWNDAELLKRVSMKPRLSRVGSALMATAVNLSRDLGYEGRIGLHSLPQAERYYEKCGLYDFGADAAYEDLHYFEMTSDAANSFLGGIT